MCLVGWVDFLWKFLKLCGIRLYGSDETYSTMHFLFFRGDEIIFFSVNVHAYMMKNILFYKTFSIEGMMHK